jgi:DNA-binding NtrC family response regulator
MQRGALVLEDQDDAREALSALIRRKGIAVCAVATVGEALKNLNGQSIAVIDLDLPDGFGTDVLWAIRTQHRPIEVAIWTGGPDRRLLAHARALRPDAVFIKPDDLHRLIAWIDSKLTQ